MEKKDDEVVRKEEVGEVEVEEEEVVVVEEVEDEIDKGKLRQGRKVL